jgi:hypothetical protein
MNRPAHDPVQEYLDTLRGMGPSDKLRRDIDEVEQEHRRRIAEREAKGKKPPMGFRKPASH